MTIIDLTYIFIITFGVLFLLFLNEVDYSV